MVDLIQIYDGAFYCPARKWENKKHSQTNWRHHIIPFKSPNVFYFSVSAFLKLFYSALALITLFGQSKAHHNDLAPTDETPE